MNIEEYRAMKAKEQEVVDNPPQTEEPATPEVVETPPEQPAPEEQSVADKIKLGDEEYDLAQIEEFKKGYVRQQEYIEKLQELERKEAEIEYAKQVMAEVQKDPELLGKVTQKAPQLSPEAIKVQQMEKELNDLKVQREVDRLTAKYPDFDVQAVAKVIEEKGITNIEDAYLLSVKTQPQAQPTIDVEALKAELRAELLKEIEASSVPQSLIATNGVANTPQVKEVKISEAEAKVAKMMGMSADDYIKWRDK